LTARRRRRRTEPPAERLRFSRANAGVPIRESFVHYTRLEPGFIHLLDRPHWAAAANRGAQKRPRDTEDQLPGGWNRRGMPKVRRR